MSRRRKLSVLERKVLHIASCHEAAAAALNPKMLRMPQNGEFWATVRLWDEHLTVAMHLKRAIIKARSAHAKHSNRRASS